MWLDISTKIVFISSQSQVFWAPIISFQYLYSLNDNYDIIWIILTQTMCEVLKSVSSVWRLVWHWAVGFHPKNIKQLFPGD